jgi:hypothetical protein
MWGVFKNKQSKTESTNVAIAGVGTNVATGGVETNVATGGVETNVATAEAGAADIVTALPEIDEKKNYVANALKQRHLDIVKLNTRLIYKNLCNFELWTIKYSESEYTPSASLYMDQTFNVDLKYDMDIKEIADLTSITLYNECTAGEGNSIFIKRDDDDTYEYCGGIIPTYKINIVKMFYRIVLHGPYYEEPQPGTLEERLINEYNERKEKYIRTIMENIQDESKWIKYNKNDKNDKNIPVLYNGYYIEIATGPLHHNICYQIAKQENIEFIYQDLDKPYLFIYEIKIQ